jgi:oxygen-independent coproporphyrinogen-3 oxidase
MSLGVQDFDGEVQIAINRIQSFDMIEAAVGEMRRAGVNDVSFDLLYGLPKQTIPSFAETIDKTIALSPDRVAVFGYAHLPAVLPRQRLVDEAALPPEEMRADLAAMADDRLVGAGYRRIGFDHYAKPDNPLARAEIEGRLRRNFQGFTDDPADTTLGVGASAISFVGGLYAQNARALGDYYRQIENRTLATARGLVLSPKEARIGRTIREILCRSRADVADLLAALSPMEANAVCARLDELEGEGVISWDGNIVALATDARVFSRIVAAALDPYEAFNKDNPALNLARAV